MIPLLTHHVATAAVFTVAFAALARALRGVTTSGAAAGTVVCFLLYFGAGPGAFAALVLVFALAWITTRLGYQRKQKLGTAEPREGRKASQVLANLGVAALCAALNAARPGHSVYPLAMAAALCEAAADTVSSELGQVANQSPRLITTWRAVPAGTNGGVTALGTIAGAGAAFLVSLLCVLTGLLDWKSFGIAALAGVLGMLSDSVLGASLEQRGLLNNDAVNLISTFIAALAAVLASLAF
jgi:uncharacterized protein (TIGR00297 family)